MAEYVQGRADGIIFRKEGNEYAVFNPWKNKWLDVSRSDGADEFHDYDNNRTSCTGSNIDEVIKAQSEYCKTHEGEKCDLSELASIVLE